MIDTAKTDSFLTSQETIIGGTMIKFRVRFFYVSSDNWVCREVVLYCGTN